MDVNELKAAIEAIIFVAEEPVSMLKLKEIFSEESFDKLQTAVADLIKDFNHGKPGLEISEVAGGLRMTTRPEFHEWVRAYLKTRPSAKLSLASLETLAVIAYRQPITLAEILAIRGIRSTSTIRTLIEKKFITSCGRKKLVGRPILYGTTREFLIHFGLKDLRELPTLEEFEELMGVPTPPEVSSKPGPVPAEEPGEGLSKLDSELVPAQDKLEDGSSESMEEPVPVEDPGNSSYRM